jgi:hypothetical protein
MSHDIELSADPYRSRAAAVALVESSPAVEGVTSDGKRVLIGGMVATNCGSFLGLDCVVMVADEGGLRDVFVLTTVGPTVGAVCQSLAEDSRVRAIPSAAELIVKARGLLLRVSRGPMGTVASAGDAPYHAQEDAR